MSAPKLVESVPAVSVPAQLSEVRQSRRSYRRNVIAGALLLVLCLGEIVFYFVAGLAS